ncbi:Strongly-conserved Zn-finger binding protein (TFIIIA) [Scheffersomyces stipitis CBS 6054]|uniref:Transcription factor IIIA n=1 Tax=Scheffersomyces stipitis (strain ATCC 58785 / CBS 6054 / NBRC 10063 / NRRL Y-11545) TaxID=322104 RepID=A3LT03_PICST|nr:Strongly-conserved Zn-finger binding protein (TFIIIA) [Scheffersomyces stipitis CBS 6054]ABN66323.2 Strongly-conserved Zn-finger binding protein (TFIIIA) [Scheffersomyces stipitis CBS 6054]
MSSDTASVTSTGSSALPKKYLCDFEGCTKAYAKPSLLEQHKRSHTNERPYKCSSPDCGKSFMRQSHLDAHLLSHADNGTKPYHCSVCGKGVNSLQHLKRHEITHTKSFVCTHEGCSESFYKHQSLRHHILSVHERTLSCSICNKNFSRPYRLAQHNLKYHSDSPAYQCDHAGCFSNFKTWSALQLHIKTEHPKLKCPVCGKGCVGRKGLRSHMISHDEEKMIKLWNCNYCNIGKFSKKIDLVEHYNSLHDGNIPEDLLKPNEKMRLEELLSETDDVTNLADLKSLPGSRYEFLDEEEDEEQELVLENRFEAPNSIKSMDSFENSLRRISVIGLISNNFSSKTIKCPKKNCARAFSREYDLTRHLKWHEEHMKKIEDFLNSVEKEETISPSKIEDDEYDSASEPPSKRQKLPARYETLTNDNDNDNDNDDDLDALIDVELRSIKAGDSSF